MDTKALRQKILDLAIRGKLVPQDPNDEPAAVLLERIREQKRQMVKEGKLKEKDVKNDTVIFVGEDNLHYEKFQDGTVKCIEDEIPFEVPEGWEWCRLSNCCSKEIKRGKSPKYIEKSGTLVFAQKCNTKYDGINVGLALYLDENLLYKYPNEEYMKDGDIVINSTGTGTLGRVGIYRNDDNIKGLPIVPDSHVTILRACSSINFLYLYAFVKAMQRELEGKGEGSTNQKELKPITLKELLVPMPPNSEQKRIQEKLLGINIAIDDIDRNRKSLKEHIQAVKSKILDLAIRGKLVPQDPNDEPASVLLERIRAEKEELIKQGKIKRNKKESVIYKGDDNSYYEKIGSSVENINDSIPFKIPDTWSWCRGFSCFAGMESKKPSGEFFNYIDIDSIDNHLHRIKEPKHLPVSDAPSRANRAVLNGSVLFSLVRPYLENIALVDENYANCIASTGFYICNSQGTLFPEYMFYLMISRYVVDGLNQFMKGDNSPSISKDNIENWLYPIPPINEQKMICKKLKMIITKIETIEKSLS